MNSSYRIECVFKCLWWHNGKWTRIKTRTYEEIMISKINNVIWCNSYIFVGNIAPGQSFNLAGSNSEIQCSWLIHMDVMVVYRGVFGLFKTLHYTLMLFYGSPLLWLCLHSVCQFSSGSFGRAGDMKHSLRCDVTWVECKLFGPNCDFESCHFKTMHYILTICTQWKRRHESSWVSTCKCNC